MGTDDVAAGRIATEHLIQLGRRHIAHIGGELISTSVGRLKGYKEALKANQFHSASSLLSFDRELQRPAFKLGTAP